MPPGCTRPSCCAAPTSCWSTPARSAQEYGDAGLGPVVAFLRERPPAARIAVRPVPGTEWLIRAEAGERVELLPADREACVARVAVLCGAPLSGY